MSQRSSPQRPSSQHPSSQSGVLQHIAIIMDGNNRWAKKQGFAHLRGHKAGVERIRDMLTICRDRHVQALTLFAFSSENWRRPRREVDALMDLFHAYLTSEAPQLHEQGVRLRVIGSRERFSKKILAAIDYAEHITQAGRSQLIIAADYGGKWDIAQACRRIGEKIKKGELEPDAVDERLFEEYVSLSDLPPVDLLVRTGEELRISNFLLWQIAYAELYFSNKLWPDFSENDLAAAIDEFYRRQRRFGLSGDQVEGDAGEANRA